ncbi:non-ribosomal peptide synthetase [Amaricoccus sp.]|uniref:non-ribosomal peptide synthetase n=1 Tax=Amaricoccus sp. TaxID=1872485 RepID=UPI001B73FEF0|nr:non-ribosomal peptide synthetase [Amaricoccus sp.]MBP7241271.1 amino acid adenylation domain-containing protein [Amaricoccus sp.]
MNELSEYVFPLSHAQQRLWFLDRMAPGNPFYNIPLAIPIAARLDVPVLERALNAIIRRHETLRTVFDEVDGEPAQIVRETMRLRIEVVDISRIAPHEREAKTVELATAEAVRPFNLRDGPLLRCGVIRRGFADNVLLLSMHHIVSDGWSMSVLARELTSLYQSYAMGRGDTLPELPIQYADFTIWQRERLEGETLRADLDYWRQQLAGLPVLDLPTDRPRPDTASFRGAAHLVALDPGLSAAVREVGRRVGATTYMTLLAAFAATMARRSGQDDIVIGAPVAGRTQPELEGLIGFFVNSVVFRIDASGDPTFLTLLERVRDTCLDAYAHQELPFERLVEELNPGRDASRNPLFQVTFQLVNTPTFGAAGGGEARVEVHRGSAIFDLAFTLIDAPDCYRGMIEYSTDLFDAATIARIAEEFETLLRAAAAGPELAVSRLPVIGAADAAILAAHEAGPRRPLPGNPAYVIDEIAARASERPDATAIEMGEGRLSYGELARRWTALAAQLGGLGIGPEARVGLLLDRSPDLIVAQLATMSAGAAYVPLDTSYPRDHLAMIAGDAGLSAILTASPLLDVAREIAPVGASVIALDRIEAGTAAGDATGVTGPQHGEGAAYLIYTSGSTGRPKGVVVTNGALANHMRWMIARFGFDASTRVLQRTASSFDASVWEILAPLMAGGTLVLLPPEAQRDPEWIVQCLDRHRVSVLQVVPSLLRILLDEPAFYLCAGLRQVFSGGEALPEDLRARLASGLGLDVANLYGPTETTIEVAAAATDGSPQPFGVPVGHPIDNSALRVLDRHHARLPVGVVGEVYVSGASLARGYHGRPAATAEVFLPDPFSETPGARMYRTRDLAFRRGDGALVYRGRTDDQIKLRGYRVEFGEIEARIREVDGVSDCAVFTPAGSGTLLAAVVPGAGAGGDGDESLFATHLDQWEDLYESLYDQLSEAAEPDFDTIGWTSSYTGEDIDPAEMATWRDTTVERILALKPDRVLEIGCGTGLLLTKIAPRCALYVGSDISGPVIRQLGRRLDTLGLSDRTVLHKRRADELDDFEPASFDTVILNSVVQYFPSAAYLARVIGSATRLVRPGGAIFVGDVRSHALLTAFHASLAQSRLGDGATGEELLHQAHREAGQEKELALDGGFFHAVAMAEPRIAGVACACKRGGFDNELGRFRYDVTLRIGAPQAPAKSARLDWRGDSLDLRSLGARLRQTDADCVVVGGIPNARVAAPFRLAALVRNGAAQRSLGELGQVAAEALNGAVDPEELHGLAETTPMDVRVRFADARPDHLEAVFWRRGDPPPADERPEALPTAPEGYRGLANDPLAAARFQELTQRLRVHLSDCLPEHMIPSLFVQRRSLPLKANGKLDRRALASSEHDRSATHGACIAPRNSIEEALSTIWAEVLEVGRIGIDDDFFTALGGHSLLAVQVVNKVRDTLRIEAPLRTIFEAPSVRDFAAALEASNGESLTKAAALFVRVRELSEAEVDAALQPDPGVRASGARR